MKRESALVGFGLVGLVTLGAALALARCSDGEPRPPQHSPRSEPARQSPAEIGARASSDDVAPPAGTAPAASVVPEPARATAAAAASAKPGEAPPTSTGGSFVARALAASEPADLELLGRIERELGREPPPEVHTILRRRKEGASRDELAGMARALPDLRLRVLVLRWVNEVHPAAGGTDAGVRAPAVGPASSATPFVKRIEPVH